MASAATAAAAPPRGIAGADPTNIMGILQQAADIRSAADAKERTVFDAWPEYLKNTLAGSDSAKAAQKAAVAARVRLSCSLRQEGNKKFAAGAFESAYQLYLQSAGALRWIESSSPNIRKTGIKDVDLSVVSSVPLLAEAPQRPADACEAELVASVLHRDASASSAARGGPTRLPTIEIEESSGDWEDICLADVATARDGLVKAYSNMSASLLGLGRHALAISAATDALRADPSFGKAYYHRGKALRSSPGAGLAELEEAVKDFRVATLLRPDDARLEMELSKAARELREARGSAKAMYKGAFAKGGVADEADIERDRARQAKLRADARAKLEADSADEAGGAMGVVGDLLQTVDSLRRNGEHQRADEIMEEAARIARAHANDQLPQAEDAIDWENPSPEAVARAKQAGVDLTDPDVREELKELDRLRREEPEAFSRASATARSEMGSDPEALPGMRCRGAQGIATMGAREAVRRATEDKARRLARGGETAGGRAAGETGDDKEQGMAEEDMLRTVQRLPASELRKLLTEHAALQADEAAGMNLGELRKRGEAFVHELIKAKSQGSETIQWWVPLAAVTLMVAFILWRLLGTGTLQWLGQVTGLGFGGLFDRSASSAMSAATAGMGSMEPASHGDGGADAAGWDASDTITATVGADGGVHVA